MKPDLLQEFLSPSWLIPKLGQRKSDEKQTSGFSRYISIILRNTNQINFPMLRFKVVDKHFETAALLYL